MIRRRKHTMTTNPFHLIHNNHVGLSRREWQTTRLLALGASVADAAAIMDIARNTVDNHRTRAFARLGVSKIADLTRVAIRLGIITADEELTREEKKKRQQHAENSARKSD